MDDRRWRVNGEEWWWVTVAMVTWVGGDGRCDVKETGDGDVYIYIYIEINIRFVYRLTERI